MTDTNGRRERLSSLSSRPISVEENRPRVDEASAAEANRIMRHLLELETIEKLEEAGKFSKAKWKMQVWIHSERSVHKPLTFTFTVWESGKRLHGGGDESTFICKRNPAAPRPKTAPFGALGSSSTFSRVATPDGCGGIIPGEVASGGRVACPHCGVTWDTEHIADSLFYRLPIEVAVSTLAKWFHQLGDNCDIYLKYRPEDVRVLSQAQDFGIHVAVKLKGLSIYPLARIIRDVSAGASLESRIRAFLLS